jgi:hypothetical protein
LGTSLNNQSGTSSNYQLGTLSNNQLGTSSNNQLGTSLNNQFGTSLNNQSGTSLNNSFLNVYQFTTSCEHCKIVIEQNKIHNHLKKCVANVEKCNRCGAKVNREYKMTHSSLCQPQSLVTNNIPNAKNTVSSDLGLNLVGVYIMKCGKCRGPINPKKYQEHLDNDCSQHIIKCTKCDDRLPRSSIAAHIQTSHK